jgi:hypothetical protein
MVLAESWNHKWFWLNQGTKMVLAESKNDKWFWLNQRTTNGSG